VNKNLSFVERAEVRGLGVAQPDDAKELVIDRIDHGNRV
jgi:hypothetical protein